MAKGAKKSRSKLMASTLNFCFGNYTLFKGKSMFSLNEGEIIDSFQGFLSDLDTISYASHLCELIDISMVEGESNRVLFKEFVIAFYLMKNGACDIENLVRAFEIKLLTLTGYGLITEHCVKCRKKLNTSNYISYEYYGGICTECQRRNGKFVSYATFNTLKFLSKLQLDKIYRVNLNHEIKTEIYSILSDLIFQSYGKRTKSLEILYSLRRKD
jgi:DNA repair protein RecO (recombination protein O)